ncbi:MAG: hypothetical protein Q4D87_02515 [Actinomycetaceae bacterium]|nr:hypothetical protein [Actinomycetaceae bacterium]
MKKAVAGFVVSFVYFAVFLASVTYTNYWQETTESNLRSALLIPAAVVIFVTAGRSKTVPKWYSVWSTLLMFGALYAHGKYSMSALVGTGDTVGMLTHLLLLAVFAFGALAMVRQGSAYITHRKETAKSRESSTANPSAAE